MSRSSSESANPQSLDAHNEFAFWVEPGTSARVEYALPLFHELDFQVNEGYRRIPHGGVEIGGFLWGRLTAETLTVEAFRQIDCEHASGPSFHLSERDLEAAANLLAKASSDEDLARLQPVGWFIAHTRTALTLTDRELALFDRWFPEPGRLTILVKPERFQPTRFGFLLRKSDGSVPRDATSSAVILPLPGRASKGMAASIPAPQPKPVVAPPSPNAVEPVKREQVQLEHVGIEQGKAGQIEPEPVKAEPVKTEPVPPRSTLPLRQGKKAAKVPLPDPTPAKVQAAPEAEVAPESPRKRPEQFRGLPETQPSPMPVPVLAEPRRSGSTTRLFFLLLLAAALGCAVGYFAYLQLPSPYITLQAEKRDGTLLVEWPASQTQGVDHAAVRVDDGPPQSLTAQQKMTGRFEVQPRTDNTKVEVIAQHWIRDSRGIIRYLAAPANPAPASAPAVPAPRSPEP